jgi:hypothetical protein
MRKTEPADTLSPSDQLLVQAFAQLDRTALGVALGATCGLAIFFATNFLILKGGENVGQNLQLLSQYFFGYSVTLTGSIIGFAYGLIVGFVLGWSIAFTRNLFMSAYLHIIRPSCCRPWPDGHRAGAPVGRPRSRSVLRARRPLW